MFVITSGCAQTLQKIYDGLQSTEKDKITQIYNNLYINNSTVNTNKGNTVMMLPSMNKQVSHTKNQGTGKQDVMMQKFEIMHVYLAQRGSQNKSGIEGDTETAESTSENVSLDSNDVRQQIIKNKAFKEKLSKSFDVVFQKICFDAFKIVANKFDCSASPY